MSVPALPLVDGSPCLQWAPQQRSLYNKLPIVLFEKEVKFRKKRGAWRKPFGKMNWQQNSGTLMRGVVTEPPPVKRQFAFGEPISSPAKKDIIQYRERTFDVGLRHQKFESPPFDWLPSFIDFISKKLGPNINFVLDWQETFLDMFYRGVMFHYAPAVYYPNHLEQQFDTAAPIGAGNAAGTSGKSLAYLKDRLMNAGHPGNFSLSAVLNGINFLEESQKAVPYQAGSDGDFLNDKWMVMLSGEAHSMFAIDPLRLELRNVSKDALAEGFKGDLMERATFVLHNMPIRIAIDEDGDVSFPEPETIEENPDAPNFGQTVQNPAYANAAFEVAFIVGANAYDLVDPGPPPVDFSKTGGDKVGGLRWNGKPRVTDKVLIPCTPDGEETPIYEPNAYDEVIKVISYLVFGAAPVTTRNVLPVIFRRLRTFSPTLA